MQYVPVLAVKSMILLDFPEILMIFMANEICHKYRCEGRFFDEILKEGDKSSRNCCFVKICGTNNMGNNG